MAAFAPADRPLLVAVLGVVIGEFVVVEVVVADIDVKEVVEIVWVSNAELCEEESTFDVEAELGRTSTGIEARAGGDVPEEADATGATRVGRGAGINSKPGDDAALAALESSLAIGSPRIDDRSWAHTAASRVATPAMRIAGRISTGGSK